MARTERKPDNTRPDWNEVLIRYLKDLVRHADMVLDQLDLWVDREASSRLYSDSHDWEKCVKLITKSASSTTTAERSLLEMLRLRHVRRPPTKQMKAVIDDKSGERDYLIRLLGNLVQGYEELVERRSRELLEDDGEISPETWKIFWCGDKANKRDGILGDYLWKLSRLQRMERKVRNLQRIEKEAKSLRRKLGLADTLSAQRRGGAARAQKLTSEERIAIAKKAAAARWSKKSQEAS